MTGAGSVAVYLAGEGRNELGSRFGDPSWQSDDAPGVVATLLKRIQPDGWHVAGARRWCEARKLRVGVHWHRHWHRPQGLGTGKFARTC